MSIEIANPPFVSIVMAVKNGGQIMRQALDSILGQSFQDFEFIIINDGSTDETLEVLAEYHDDRIRIFSQENQGLSRSLNRGLQLARGKYIARQDHDDISLPERLQKQVQYLELHPNCGLLGSAAEIWDVKSFTGRVHDHPTDPATLYFELLFNNPFVHTSWMFRADVISSIGLYTNDPQREPPEDYEYVSRLARKFEVANLSERLVIYREFPNSLSSELRVNSVNGRRPFNEKLALISAENIAYLNGIPANDKGAVFFGSLTHSYFQGLKKDVSFIELTRLVNGAARKIEQQFGTAIEKELINKRLNTLRYQYLRCGIPSKLHLLIAFFCADGMSHFLSLLKRYLIREKHRASNFVGRIFLGSNSKD